MDAKDVEQLRSRIKTALAASAEEFGKAARPKGAPDRYAVPFEDVACHLVTPDDTRIILTDPAVKALGGKDFALEIAPARNEIVVTPKEPEAEPEPAKAATKAAEKAKGG